MLRRDPALWSRPPVRRSTQSAVRPARSFSKTGPAFARHNDEQDQHDGKKPDGMSDLEWMRQRHLRRWRKRIEQDPYAALFGASEEMLRGRGLEAYIERQREMHRKGLGWVQKTFPKWMLEDMGLRHGNRSTAEETVWDRYTKKVKMDANEHAQAKESEITPRQPWYKDWRFEKDLGNEGVKSPSDSRWPREQPLSSLQTPEALHEDMTQELRKDKQVLKHDVTHQQAPAEMSESDNALSEEPIPQISFTPRKENQTIECDALIEEVRARNEAGASSRVSEPGNNKDWRQTALERRAERNPISESRRKTDVPVIDVTAKDKARHGIGPLVERTVRLPVGSHIASRSTADKVVIDFNGISSSRVGRKEVEELESRVERISEEAKQHCNIARDPQDSKYTPIKKFSPYPRINTDDWVVPPSKDAIKELDEVAHVKLSSLSTEDINFSQTGPKTSFSPRKSTSDILKQLPADDLDFLTADDVRASMGRTKGGREDKVAVRQKLEEEYGKDTPEIDPLLEAQVMNDQYVRRKTSEMASTQGQSNGVESEATKPASRQGIEDTSAKPVSVLETGLDFMSRWLHNGGNVFAQHFWQDPVQLVAGQLSNADEQFLKGIGMGVLKGRRAFASIKDELVDDIPVVQELVNRLNRDEIKASAGAVKLYRDLPYALKDTSDAEASKAAAHKRIGKLRQELLDTDKQYKKACETVDGLKYDSKPSFLQRKRLRYASDVLQKNAKLTRMAIFGLQGRIEVESGNSGGLVACELLHRLLTLQDTQLALSRLVSRAIQVLGINMKAEEEVSMKNDASSTFNLSSTLVVEAPAPVPAKTNPSKLTVDTAAADAQLEDEVSNQKAAMRGLSDDGYKHPPKSLIRQSFDGPNPLAHSLFRPFGLQLESLGKDAEAVESEVANTAKKARGDRTLVKEVKRAYEDMYGAITVDHWQIPLTEQSAATVEGAMRVHEAGIAERQPSMQMLKEDDLSPIVTGDAQITTADAASVPKDDDAAKENAADLQAESKGIVSSEDVEVKALRHPITSDIHLGTQESSGTFLTSGAEQHRPIANSQATDDTLASSVNLENEYSHDIVTDTYVPISYKTLIYNAETDKLSITISKVPQPNPPIMPIPLHEALSTLSHPAKFVDHLPESFHVLQVKADVLSVRTASPFNATAEKNTTTTVDKSNVEKIDLEDVEGWKGINPVDGTTTLSPTGFVSVGSDLDRDFAERRRKADEYHREMDKSKKNIDLPDRKKRVRVGVGGVVKTAIWAGAFCYVVGVAAEVAKAPF